MMTGLPLIFLILMSLVLLMIFRSFERGEYIPPWKW